MTAQATDQEPRDVQAARMRRAGESYVAIGKAFGVSDKSARRYVEKGEAALAAQEAESKRGGGPRRWTTETAQEVVRMRHDDELSWRQIATKLGLGTPGTARRAYRAALDLPKNAPLGRLPGKGGRAAWVREYAPGHGTEGGDEE